MKALRTSLVVSTLSAVTLALSFINQLAIAHAFGASAELDVYLEAVSVPVLLMGSVSGIFGYAMVPTLVRARLAAGDSRGIAGRFLGTFILIAAVVAAMGWWLGPVLFRALAPGGAHGDLSLEGMFVARIAWLSLAACIVVGFLGALANANERFLAPVLASGLPYLGTLVACLAFGSTRGTGVLAVGLACGYAAALLALLWPLRHELRWTRTEDLGGELARFFVRSPLALFSVLSFTIFPVVDAFWAPRTGSGSLSALAYCQRVLVAIGAVVAVGPATVIQPAMAEAASAGRLDVLQAKLGATLRASLAVCAPAAVIIAILRVPLVQLAFERGAFDAEATRRVSDLLPLMLAGMVPMVCVVVIFKAIFAREDSRSAVMLGLAGPLIYFSLSGVFSRAFGARGIAAAYCVTWYVLAAVGVGVMWGTRWRNALGPAGSRFGWPLVTALVGAGASTWLASRALLPVSLAAGGTIVGVAATTALAAAAGMAAYVLAVTRLQPMTDIANLRRAIADRRVAARSGT